MADALFVVSPTFTPSTFFFCGINSCHGLSLSTSVARNDRRNKPHRRESNRSWLDTFFFFFTSNHLSALWKCDVLHLYPLDFHIIVTSKKKANNNMKRANEHARKNTCYRKESSRQDKRRRKLYLWRRISFSFKKDLTKPWKMLSLTKDFGFLQERLPTKPYQTAELMSAGWYILSGEYKKEIIFFQSDGLPQLSSSSRASPSPQRCRSCPPPSLFRSHRWSPHRPCTHTTVSINKYAEVRTHILWLIYML